MRCQIITFVGLEGDYKCFSLRKQLSPDTFSVNPFALVDELSRYKIMSNFMLIQTSLCKHNLTWSCDITKQVQMQKNNKTTQTRYWDSGNVPSRVDPAGKARNAVVDQKKTRNMMINDRIISCIYCKNETLTPIKL